MGLGGGGGAQDDGLAIIMISYSLSQKSMSISGGRSSFATLEMCKQVAFQFILMS